MAKAKSKPAANANIVGGLQTTDQRPEVLGSPDMGNPSSPAPGLITILEAYRLEAKSARESGTNPRDTKWRENLDLYWNRFDFTKKAKWQSTATLPEVPNFVDRFAAAITEALAAGGQFFTVEDPADTEKDLARAIKRMMDVWLSKCARTNDGHPLSFLGVFPDFIKLGAIMNMAGMVIWKDLPEGGGYVSIEPLDPRGVWIDHTRRGLYRIRRIEIDKTELLRLAREKDNKGQSLYNLPVIEQLASYLRVEMQDEGRRLSGHGIEQTSWRKPITLDEYLATLIDSSGKVVATNSLVVVANERYVIRGPEANPHWHKKDWVIYTPLIHVPLSAYGKSYMENMGSLARLFNDMTNLIMDATYTSAIKAFALRPDQLEDPSQADEGLYPNVTFKLNENGDPKKFIETIDLGALSQDSVVVWQQLKAELREASNFNELGTGQMAPKGRTSASEIVTANENSSALLRDIARTIETRFLEPMLDLVWKTGLQHLDKNDKAMQNACGEAMFGVIYSKRKELASRPITFQARGISSFIAKQSKLKGLLQLLGIIAQNQVLLATFFQKVDPGKLIDELFMLQDIDPVDLQLSPREALMKQIAGAAPGQPSPGAPGSAPMTPGNAPQSAPGPSAGGPPSGSGGLPVLGGNGEGIQ